jgi:hypothetical protein
VDVSVSCNVTGFRRGVRILALLTGVVVGVACGPSYARRPVETPPDIHVTLRGEKGGDGIVDRGYDHPITIAPVRITHVLSQIDVRDDDARSHAIPTDLLYPVGDSIARALSKAGPGEDVVVQLVERRRKLLFTHKFLTSFVLYVRNDQMFVHLRHYESEMDMDPRDDRIPEPYLHKTSMKSFRVIPGDGMEAVGDQEVAAFWRDPVFQKPRRFVVTGTGKVKRRTILMESEPEEEDDDEPSRAPPEAAGGLSPATLRELADLEEERRAGQLSEAEYQSRRRELLGDP